MITHATTDKEVATTCLMVNNWQTKEQTYRTRIPYPKLLYFKENRIRTKKQSSHICGSSNQNKLLFSSEIIRSFQDLPFIQNNS